MDWAKGALPIGMLMFGFTVFGVLRRKTGYAVARSQYPKLATKLGLSYKASRYDSGVGTLTGTMRGFSVTVDPDDQRRIVVRFTSAPAVEIWSHAHNKRPGPNMKSFRPTDRRLVSFLKTTLGDDAAIAAVHGSEDLGTWLGQLRRIRELKSFSITPSGVTAVFDYGSPPFIPPAVVAEVLPLLVSTAELFEQPTSVAPEESSIVS